MSGVNPDVTGIDGLTGLHQVVLSLIYYYCTVLAIFNFRQFI